MKRSEIKRKTPIGRGKRPSMRQVYADYQVDNGFVSPTSLKPLPKLPPIPKKPAKSKVFRKEAEGKPCMVRIPGYCLPGNDTVVLAHYSMAGYFGRGLKSDDQIFGAYACDGCHRAIDGKTRTEFTKDQLRLWHAEGCFRTQVYRLEHDNS